MNFLIQGAAREAALSPTERIIAKNSDVAGFWSNASGWAPQDAAELLSRSRLDRQVSLSESLSRWTSGPHPLSDGDLILAWTNLGCLVEGTLKLFLAVYYQDYQADAEKTQFGKVYSAKTGSHIVPDELVFESLIQYFRRAELLDADQLAFVTLLQSRRNAVHSFKDREIGTTEEFLAAVCTYLELLENLESRLPYPFP